MHSNQMIVSAVIFMVFLSLAPSITIPIGNHYQNQVEADDVDRVDMWRKARFFYRISKFSPFFWESSTQRIRETDLKLSNSMFGMIIEGSDGGFNDEDHLLFLSSREDQSYWRNQEALAQLRYGHPEETLSILEEESTPNADFAVIASLMTGNEEKFETWLPRSQAPKGVYLLSSNTHSSDDPLIDIHNALQAPQTTQWDAVLSQTGDYHNLAVEAYAQAFIIAKHEALKETAKETKKEVQVNTEETKTNTEEALVGEENDQPVQEETLANTQKWFSKEKLTKAYQAIETPHACTTLAVGIALERTDMLTEANLALQKEEFFFTQLSIGAHVLCRPLLFRKAYELAESLEEKSDWLIFEAHGQLGQHQISKAQKLLKQVESNEQNPQQTIKSLYLRARAREMASDTAGMEKYARKGLETKSPVFQSLMGKASLLKGKKTDSIWLLHKESSNLDLPPNLLLEYSDLCSIAKRFGGNAIKVKINYEEVAYGKWERSKEFRAWFSEYLQVVTALSPSGSPPLPILLNNQRVEQNGNFLMRAVVAEFTDPLQISNRAMLKFNYHTIRSNSDKSDAWKEFKKARIWLSKLPFPQLLSQQPELFQIQLGAL